MIVKICDFGLSQKIPNIDFKNTKFSVKSYRSPELILSEDYYDYGIDIWAAGVVIAELFLKNNLFETSDDENEEKVFFQILQITDISLEDAQLYYKSIEKVSLSHIIPTHNHDALDLLNQCFKFYSKDRITSKKALEHPYFKDIQDIIQYKRKIKK